MHDDKVTTPTISTLLLVPAAGDPTGLLAEGPCGARMPMLCLRPGHETWSRIPAFGSWDATGWRFGLVLAHEGKPVRSGCDVAEWARMEAAHAAAGEPIPGHAVPGRYLYPQAGLALRLGGHELADLKRAVRHLGTLIALDPSGRDITAEVLGG